jgi:phosphoribosylformylglycinamidine synthase
LALNSLWQKRTETWQLQALKPLAVTNCLNFGSPENPEVMWQFKQATAGLADGCLSLSIPVTGGNVSF